MKKLILFITLVSSSSVLAFTKSTSVRMLDDDETDYTSNYTSTRPASSGSGSGSGGPGIYDELNNYEPFRKAFSGSGSCSNVPSHVKKALTEAIEFSNSCPTARLAPGKRIAINDYSSQGPAQMYIFGKDGHCLKAIPISWGGGNPRTGRMEACSTENSRMTPPGFHITARHRYGARYNQNNSIGLAGLCGQNSLGERGILIHASRSQGTGSTWGCTGVPGSDFSEVQDMLGVGSLVYNYFGGKNQNNCSDSSGFEPRCEPENLAFQAASEATGRAVRREYRTGSGGGGRSRSNSRSGAR